MVTPRLRSLERVIGAKQRTRARVGRLLREARVLSVDTDFDPPRVGIEVVGYGGQTVRVMADVLSHDYSGQVTEVIPIGQLVIVACDGNPAISPCYVLGVRSSGKALVR